MKVLFCASEALPYCKTGGLADVVGSLSLELVKKGHTVTVVLPFYKEIQSKKRHLKKEKEILHAQFANRRYSARFYSKKLKPRLTYFFIDQKSLFYRAGLYGYQGGGAYPDNHLRFAFLSKAVVSLLKVKKIKPDVIHCHDWQTGLLPLYLREEAKKNPFLETCATVLTVHNNAYLGYFPGRVMRSLGLQNRPDIKSKVRMGSGLSFLKAGVQFSDFVNTVSPTYKKEIETQQQFGHGLQRTYRQKGKRFVSVLNGLDIDYWNPQKDKMLTKTYSARSLQRRRLCKLNLQKTCRWKLDVRNPIFGFVGRLDHQKGISLLVKTASFLMRKGSQIVFLGKGDRQMERSLKKLAQKFPRNVYFEHRFAERLAHKIYAGSDFFLMPSQFEPCGLGQMIALRYGAVPIVTPTGGLKDTVIDIRKSKGIGIVASSRSSQDYRIALQRALKLYLDKNRMRQTQRRGMACDWSWNKSQRHYLKIYEKAIRYRCSSRSPSPGYPRMARPVKKK